MPERVLLRRYLDRGGYVDCYVTEVPQIVSQAQYVEAFYTTSIFKLERLILSLFFARPSTDAHARELALGRTTSFAAWSVEAREASELLLSDHAGSTRSWLMSVPAPQGTRLFFGSAVLSKGFLFRALLGFHKIYSRVLLAAAVRRLARS